MEIAFPILLIIFIVLVIIIPSIIDEIILKELEKEDKPNYKKDKDERDWNRKSNKENQ